MKRILAKKAFFIFLFFIATFPMLYSDAITVEKEPDRWEYVDSIMPHGTFGGTSQKVGNKIYFFGGRTSTTDYVDGVQIYDLNSDTWSLGAPLPYLSDGLSSALIDDKIYIAGGGRVIRVEESGKDKNEWYNKFYMYDPKEDTWEQKASIPKNSARSTSVVVNKKLYLIGGVGMRESTLVYDPKTDSWREGSKVPFQISLSGGIAVNDKIFIIGGQILNPGESKDLDSDRVLVYNTSNDTWSEDYASMSNARYHAKLAVSEGYIYAVGGKNFYQELNCVERYNIEEDKWETMTPMNIRRYGFELHNINDTFLAFGGFGDGSYRNSVDIYTAPTMENKAKYKVYISEMSEDIIDISIAREATNLLPESSLKDSLQDKINNINANLKLESKSFSANVDVYIKSENALSLSLDTNLIDFVDFSGVDDMEKTNAVNLTVSSSLPYKISAHLESDIVNSDGSNTLNPSILNIKDNSIINYESFSDAVRSLTLLDNQSPGNDIIHSIDLMLRGNIAHRKDIYRAVVKFEVAQL